jgi:hypothetical protein
MQVIPFRSGGYQFIKGVFQYSAGVSAMPGNQLTRVVFAKPLPLSRGFRRIEEYIAGTGRPMSALAACELRSPAPFSEAGFKTFNEEYVGTLVRWGIIDGMVNPVARSNVCPEIGDVGEPSIYAFTYTETATNAAPSFVVAGSGEAPEGHANYHDHIVRLGDTSADAIREKARWVLGEMERRLQAMGFSWQDTTATQLYTVHDCHPFLADEIVRRGAAKAGLTSHFCRPPVVGLEYEMDCRGVHAEKVIPA